MRYLLKFLAPVVIACVLAIPVLPHQSSAAEITEFTAVLDTAEKAIKKIDEDLAKKPGGGTAQQKAIKREAQQQKEAEEQSPSEAPAPSEEKTGS